MHGDARFSHSTVDNPKLEIDDYVMRALLRS